MEKIIISKDGYIFRKVLPQPDVCSICRFSKVCGIELSDWCCKTEKILNLTKERISYLPETLPEFLEVTSKIRPIWKTPSIPYRRV